MTQLQCLPYGAGHANEGVCLLIKIGPYRVLLDCGLEDISPLVADAGKGALPADLVLCSHAHPEHAKGLLPLHQRYPKLPIYASEVTAQLLPINWPDTAANADFCQALPWRSPLEFRDGLSVESFPAGHLPGASAFLITYTASDRTYSVFYTGDFLLSNSRLVEGLPLEELRGLRPDVLIIEGSYGTTRHPHRRQQENRLADQINRAIADHQSIILPMPTLGLGQELLMLLRSHHHFTGRNIDIWVDGEVADGCDAYLALLPYFPSSVQNFARHQPLFWDERIRPKVRRVPPESEAIAAIAHAPAPSVVLIDRDADLSHYCAADACQWLLLLPQQPGRPGAIETAVYAQIEQSEELRSQLQTGHLTVDTYLLGEHCDGPGTTQLIHNLRPQHVVFFHGSPAYLSDLTGLEELQNRYQLHFPSVGVWVELPVGETFLQPAAPETSYEGEVTEFVADVSITLPKTIMDDPRWSAFADTGLVEVRWQGEELVIRGLSQRELLRQSGGLSAQASPECCDHCLHYRGQRCWNQASPLYGFRVTPEGYCPAFEFAPIASDESERQA